VVDNHEKIRVLLADDHTIFREGLRSLLEAEDDIAVVGESSTGQETIALARSLRPDIIVLDIGMPGGNGLEAASAIMKENRKSRIIILSMFDDRAHVRRATEAGARGYLIKQTAAVDLIAAIREVQTGNAFFSPAVSGVLLEQRTVNAKRPKPPELTEREVEVLKLVALGKTTPEIGNDLCISAKTVDKHRQQLMDKLDIHEIAGLTRYAISKGIVQ
jgi:DNA-binding NarL/FixJ family response regulator